MSRRITSRGHHLGWKRDTNRHNAAFYSAPRSTLTTLPSFIDLEPNMPPVYDQGEIGSCTVNAIAGIVEYDRMKEHNTPPFRPSRLFIYYNERDMEGTTGSDSGAAINDGLTTVAVAGVCPETEWPYIATPANREGVFPVGSPPATKPPIGCYMNAAKYMASGRQRVMQNVTQMKACLAQRFPFAFGFVVYSNIYGDDDNPVTYLTMPGTNDQEEGGHAVAAVGYDDAKQVFKVRNSWGTGVMQKGHFYMPYAYILEPNLADSFWMVTAETD